MSQPGTTSSTPSTTKAPRAQRLLGVNEMLLSGRQWLIVVVVVATIVTALPMLWPRFEKFPTGPDYRIPYALSRDYWLYQRRLDQLSDSDAIPVIGDSVIWGEYVRRDGTLTHFLDAQTARPGRFINGGVNGMFPLAMEGLITDYGKSIHDRKVIVQFNLLWLTSPKADLSLDNDDHFNHSRLVPQFWPRIPAYHADLSERISATLERHFPFFAWGEHIDCAYFGNESVPQWTLDEDDENPPKLPNAWRNPREQLRHGIPTEPAVDRQRGPQSYRHKPWNHDGADLVDFDWVDPDKSLQLQAFIRLIGVLKERHDDVLVILAPFNKHMIADDQLDKYHAIHHQVAAAIGATDVTLVAPETLPSELYADASHPLTDGYAKLATGLLANGEFRKWLNGNR